MSRSIILAFALASAFGLSAPATAQAPAPSSSMQVAPSPALPDHGAIKPGDRNCLRDTGSLIKAKKGECLPVPGRSYSHDDLQKTGQPDTAKALRMLDPSISGGH